MGANAQTIVPTFTAGQVLTAAQMNQSARTGVPVFATTVERDAAFGGTGEKTLAEGQLCYLESTDVVQYYNGTSWATLAPGPISAVGYNQVLAAQTTTSTSYTDLATVGATVTLTTGTSAIVLATSQCLDTNNDGVDCYISVAVSGATTIAASDNWNGYVRQDQNYDVAVSMYQFTSLTPGSNTFTMKYKKSGGTTATFGNRYLTVWAS